MQHYTCSTQSEQLCAVMGCKINHPPIGSTSQTKLFTHSQILCVFFSFTLIPDLPLFRALDLYQCLRSTVELVNRCKSSVTHPSLGKATVFISGCGK